MATDTESIHDNMTRLRMKMVQQKLANERDKLQRSESQASDNGYEDQIKLKHAMLRKQELLDKIQQEQLNSARPQTNSPRRRYSLASLPVSRRSLPEINSRHYHIGLNGYGGGRDADQVKHVIEHQFRAAPPQPIYSQFPPISAVPQLTAVQTVPVTEVVPVQPGYTWPWLTVREKKKDSMFNKSDFMDMMMLQNAQMHHMTMQQLMLYQLPGARPLTLPYADPSTSLALHGWGY